MAVKALIALLLSGCLSAQPGGAEEGPDAGANDTDGRDTDALQPSRVGIYDITWAITDGACTDAAPLVNELNVTADQATYYHESCPAQTPLPAETRGAIDVEAGDAPNDCSDFYREAAGGAHPHLRHRRRLPRRDRVRPPPHQRRRHRVLGRLPPDRTTTMSREKINEQAKRLHREWCVVHNGDTKETICRIEVMLRAAVAEGVILGATGKAEIVDAREVLDKPLHLPGRWRINE